MMRAAFLVLVACVAVPDEWSHLESLYGRGDLVAILGDGGLTLGVNGRGRVNVCRWPTPGLNDQVTYQADNIAGKGLVADPNHGLMWGLEIDGEIIWWTDDRIAARADYAEENQTIEVAARLRGTDIVIRQYLFVVPGHDAFVAQIEITGSTQVDAFHWYTNYSPCTRRMPGLAISDTPKLDQLNDFACFTDPGAGRVYHMRPEKPGKERWVFAELLAANGYDLGAWESLGEGVYIGIQAFDGIATPFALRDSPDAIKLTADGQVSTVGQVAGRLRVLPQSERQTQSAAVVNGFGASLQEVQQVLDVVTSDFPHSWTVLRRESDRRNQWKPRLPASSSPGIDEFLMRCLSIVDACTDAQTHAIVRSPASAPPLARDWPRHGVWASYALSLAGRSGDAEKHLEFYLSAVRKNHAPARPAGSLPSSLHTDGTPASPHVVLDVEAVAWLLWGLNTHASLLTRDDAHAFVQRSWDSIYDLAEFLASWKDNRRGAPLHAYNPDLFHDTQSRRLLTSAHLGIHSAIALAELGGKTAEGAWTRHATDLDILMQNLFLDPELEWPLGEPLPLGLTYIPGFDGATAVEQLRGAIDRRIDAFESMPPHATASALAEIAVIARNDEEIRTRLQAMLETTLSRILRTRTAMGVEQPAFPDSATAARAFVAATLLMTVSR